MQVEIETRSKYIALARACCPDCDGTGLDGQETCACVWRKVFRIVMRKVQDIETGRHLMRPINTLGVSHPQGRKSDRHRCSDFSADVYLTAKRTLQCTVDFDLFRYHYLLGVDWRACAKRIGLPYVENLDRKAFFDRAYRIESKLGRVFAELKPYALFPLDGYFSTGYARVRPIPVPEPRYQNGVPLRPPLAPAARTRARAVPYPIDAIKDEIRASFRQGKTLLEIAADLNKRRVRPMRADSWSLAMVARIAGPRCHRVAKPVHVAPFNINDEAAVGRACRAWFAAGRMPKGISTLLKNLGGTQYTHQRVTHLLISNPGTTRKAA